MDLGGGSPPVDMDGGSQATEAGSPSSGCPENRGHIRVTVYYRTRRRNNLENANVQIQGVGTEQTDSRGRAEFRDLEPGSYNIRVTGDNIVEGAASTTVAADRTSRVEVQVRPLGTLRVRVVDNEDNPVENATVRISGYSDGTTDAQGQYDFTNMESARYSIEASKPEYLRATENVRAEFDPGEVVEAEIVLRRIVVAIRANDGRTDPCRIVPAGGTIRLKAVPTPTTAGAYQWTTTSTKITLTNDNTQTVTVTGGNQVSSGRDAETIQVVFTPSGSPALSPVTANLTVIRVTFSQSANQNFGYDNMDNAAGVIHHVSVKKGGNTIVGVTVEGGVTGADLRFTSGNSSIAQASVPSGAGSAFDLTINGGSRNKAETSINAKCSCTDNTIIGTIQANVYREKAMTAKVAKVHDSTVAATALTRPNFDVEAAETTIKGWYKPAVATVDLTDNNSTGGVTDVRYDLNGNGKLDLEPGGTSSEERAIRTAFNPSGQKIVVVKDLSWIFYLRTAASIGDTSINLKNQYSGHMRYIVAGDSYDLGAGATLENITVASKSGTTVRLSSALTKDHPTTDGLIWPLSGLSGNPIYVAEQNKTEAKERETMGHENGHSQLRWLDLEDSDNLMHYSIGRSDTNIRFKEQPKKYETGNENQWQKITR